MIYDWKWLKIAVTHIYLIKKGTVEILRVFETEHENCGAITIFCTTIEALGSTHYKATNYKKKKKEKQRLKPTR